MQEDKDKKKKQVIKAIDLPLEALTFGFSQVELNQFTEQEFKMIASDRQEKERADARNALEEYVYELRSKVSSDDELGQYILESDRDALVRQLDEMENWLYEEGEDCNRQIYIDKLAELKSKGTSYQLISYFKNLLDLFIIFFMIYKYYFIYNQFRVLEIQKP